MNGQFEPLSQQRLQHARHLILRRARRQFRLNVVRRLVDPRGSADARAIDVISVRQQVDQRDVGIADHRRVSI
jgi:hypothetical protein